MSFIITFIIVSSVPSVEKSPPNPAIGKAAVASLILPGTGQLISGVRNRGEAMLWMDGVMWVGCAGFSWYRNSKEEDARLIAKKFAGANISIKNPQYYRALERYKSSSEYNEDIRRVARELYPDDPDAQRRYYESHGYFGEQEWNWSSDSIRIYSYWQTRRAARAAGMTVSFLTAGLVLNRLISAFDCLFFLPEQPLSKRVEVKPAPADFGLALYWHF